MKTTIPGLVFAFIADAALAQQLPGAGGQLRQLPPPPLVSRPVIPDTRPTRSSVSASDATAGPSFKVNTLRVSGITLFAEDRLVAVAGFVPGSSLSLGDLRLLADKITEYYNANGYFVAQAYLPAQIITDGVVTLAVIEGRYGAVSLNNESRVSNGTVQRILAGLESGDVVRNEPLERRLLLMSDLPGTRIRSTISPGVAVGTSDLLVEVAPGRAVTGNIEADNAGNRYTGYFRGGGTLNVNNPFGIGDVASVRGLVTDGGLTYARGSYQAPVGALTLGIAYARLDYRLGKEFRALGAHGSADIASIFASYPLLRTYDYNIYLQAAGDLKFFHDEVDTAAAVIDRHSKVATLSVSGDGRDSTGSSFWSIGWTVGSLDIRTAAARAVDAVTAQTNGGFHKLSLSAGRLQSITDSLSLFIAARGQLASKNLDISEKMQLGGAYGVRAYPEGEGFGDQGYIVTAEARLRVAEQLPGDLSLFAFIDHGDVTFNRNRFSPAPNSARLSGAGGGVVWAANGNFQLRASYAHRLGNAPVMSGPDAPGQVWVQATKQF